MKNKILKYTAIAAILFAFSSCVKTEYDQPEAAVHSVKFTENTTIAELKALSSGAYTEITDDLIIKGTVISDDKTGNFYKKLILQDSTGGIEIGIDQNDLYATYPTGEWVYVKCKGLKIGKNHEIPQLALEVNGNTGRLPMGAHKYFLFRADGGKPIVPKEMSIDKLGEKNINTLIKLKNVEFVKGDTAKTFADNGSDANRSLTDYFENTLIVRTSSYSDFATSPVPNGNGTFTGVFSVYNNDYQIFVRSLDEIDMDGDRIVKNTIYSEDFTNNINAFSQHSVAGSKQWIHSAFGGNTYAKITGYNAGAQENWLVSPAIDLSAYQNASMTFVQGVGYFNSWDDLTVWVSADYDGTSKPTESGTWTQITGYNYPTTGSGNWSQFVSSGGILLSDYVGKNAVHVAFKYVCGTSNASTWEVASLEVSGQE